MRITTDTNILISAILFPNGRTNELMRIIAEKHKLILSSFVIEELMGVVKKKFGGKREAADRFLSKFPYEMVLYPERNEAGLISNSRRKRLSCFVYCHHGGC